MLGSYNQERCTQAWCSRSMVFVKAVRNQMVPPCVEWCVEMDNQATTPFGYCPSLVVLFVQLHCANARWNRCQGHLNSFPLWELEETTRTPSYYVDEDYPAAPQIQQPLPKWSNWRSSEWSTLETDVYIWCYVLIVVHARREKELPGTFTNLCT